MFVFTVLYFYLYWVFWLALFLEITPLSLYSLLNCDIMGGKALKSLKSAVFPL